MKIHYFSQATADADDHTLGMAKMQGYVPDTCLLGGVLVMSLVTDGKSPCDGCGGPREVCKGKGSTDGPTHDAPDTKFRTRFPIPKFSQSGLSGTRADVIICDDYGDPVIPDPKNHFVKPRQDRLSDEEFMKAMGTLPKILP